MSRFNEVIKKCSNGNLIIKEIDKNTAKEMCLRNHYSHKWNNAFGKINFGIFKDNKLLGCAVFGNLMNSNSYKSISNDLDKDSIIELNRLWVDDVLGKNTESMFLSACFKLIKENHRHVKLVQSFSDGRLGCGTIYKSSNFDYYGFSESVFFEDVTNGEVFHKVPLEVTNRPKGMIEKNYKYITNQLKPFKVRTYRYIYKINKYVNINLKKLNYPDYHIGIDYLDKYDHGINNIVRAYMLSFLLNTKEQFEFEKWLINKLGKQEFKKLVNNNLKNKSILEVVEKRGLYSRLCELTDLIYK